ncbi:hypothetical protein GN278_07320 [Rhodobacteraceae bacterium Araon29]
MVVFEDLQDITEWLEPLDYLAFWNAVEPYNLTLQDRDHCDELIANGKVGASLILDVLKGLAEMELRKVLNLNDRIHETVDYQYLKSTH